MPNNDRREFNFSFKISRGNKSTPKSARSPSPPRKKTKQSKVTTTTRHVRTSPPSSPYSLPSPTFDQRVFVDVSPSPPRQKTKESKLPKTTRHVPTSPPLSPHSLPSTTVTPQSSPSTKHLLRRKDPETLLHHTNNENVRGFHHRLYHHHPVASIHQLIYQTAIPS